MGDASTDVRRAACGDRDAFARLYERYARPVFLDLAARLRRREDAEDALQATFLSAWSHLPRLKNPERLVPWLFRIARNKARDLRRRERTRPLRIAADEELIGPDGREAEPELDGLRALVAGLRPASRAIVLLRVVEGWSAEEVAAAQGISAATVRRRYADALAHLRRALEGRSRDDEAKRTGDSRRACL